MAFDHPVQCGIMKENSTQCTNNAWAYWNDIPKCRLHFCFDLAKADDLSFEAKIINSLDQPDLDNLLKIRQEQLQ